MPKCIFTAAALIALAGSAHAQDRWATTDSGCRVWIDHPRPQQTVTWSGDCQAGDMADGKGTLVHAFVENGIRFESRYNGRMREGAMSGSGELFFPNGDIYEGRFHDGLRSGSGVYSWANGNRYKGEFSEDTMNGKGEFVWANGDRYVGQFRDGTLNGSGQYTWASGDTYSGEFLDGRPANR